MFAKMNAGFIVLSLFIAAEQVLGRERWFERNDKPVFLHPRRFDQERPAVLQKLRDACPGEVCGTLAGQAVTPLLAAQPECSQQDMADAIIDASRQFDAVIQANMIAIAKEYRQAEKNTPPDFDTNPPTLRNSVFCQKAPKNLELGGLVQAQDPANDPDVFFDPATKSSVKRGIQPNTSPFNGTAATGNGNSGNRRSNANDGNTGDAGDGAKGRNKNNTKVNNGKNAEGNNGKSGKNNGDDDDDNDDDDNDDIPSSTLALVSGQPSAATATAIRAEISQPPSGCPTAVTITVSATNPAASVMNAITVTVSNPSPTVGPAPTASVAPNGADFGSCTTPEIEFGVGFDNRRETSFQPADKISYPHNSAQNVNIITQFICDSLTNTCNANQAAKDLCSTARTAASSAKAGTGSQADAFNDVFGIQTSFVDTPSVDNQGSVVPGTGTANGGNGNGTSTTRSPGPETLTVALPAATSAASGAIGNFGSCSTPEIEFGAGFDNRKEASFRPIDLASFNHGSAQNIAIVTDFICDELTNSCKADQTAKDTCARAATAAANANPKGSGAQADAFNAVFGKQTDFVNVQQIDDQGRPVRNGGANGGGTILPAATTTARPTRPSNVIPPTTTTAPPQNNGANLQTFTGSLGGVPAPAVSDLGNGRFAVEGNSEFNNRESAFTRSCDVQNNKCADAANASGNKNGFTVQACNQQQSQCKAAVGT